jgi:hypothetical protein
MSWTDGDATLSASCRTIGGEHADQGEYCQITVSDSKLYETEFSIQQEANDAARKSAAPPPPEL